jgi:hypothetical protein
MSARRRPQVGHTVVRRCRRCSTWTASSSSRPSWWVANGSLPSRPRPRWSAVGWWRAGHAARPAHGLGAGPADRRPAGGAGLAQAPVALSGAGLRGADLDRAGGRHPASGGADRAGPGRGVPAGRHRRPRGGRGRPRPGVGWATIMRAVAEHGTRLVDDPARLDGVAALGLDETGFRKATRRAPPSGSLAWSTWRVVVCWMWWPTAPGPPSAAGCMLGP